MSGVKVQYVIQTEDPNPWGAVLLGTGELDKDAYEQDKDGLWLLRQVPDQLRQIADQLESAMTTGPDPTWLGDQ